MNGSKLIVLEGIDCSGKSTLAMMLSEYLNWRHEHEPTFTSAEADNLNFAELDSFQREYFFMKDRLQHQDVLKRFDIVLDRYILSGLAYAEAFSPRAIPMMKSIYRMNHEFKHPDLTIFIDMPPKKALELNISRIKDRNEQLDLTTLEKIRSCFLKHLVTMRNWGQEIQIMYPIPGDIDNTFKDLIRRTDAFFEGKNLRT